MKIADKKIDLKEALKRWQDNDLVFSLEMGGLGPGYEQCIQIGVFELCQFLVDKIIPSENDAKEIDEFIDHALRAILPHHKALEGLSVAQAGAIKSLAYRFLTEGYEETLRDFPTDRLIQVGRVFP